MARIAANGIDVNCEIGGPDGAPVVLCLHSLATDLSVWDELLPELESRFRVVRADLRGHGGTTATPPPYDLQLLVDDARALLDALVVARASVVGLSIGAIIALGLALDAPHRLDRIVVADCRADAPPAYVSLWDGVIETATTVGLEPVIDSSLERWFAASFRASGAPVIDEVRTRALRTPVDGLVGVARAVQGLAYLDRLGEISVPALFVVGEEDPAAPPQVMRDMADRVPGAELVVLPGAGHLTPVEVPDAFRAAVVPFLEKR